MDDTFINVFRASSGSQVIYYNSNEAEPSGITNKTIISKFYNTSSIPNISNERIIWKWNGTDLSQFDLFPVQSQNMSASLEIVTSSYSPTSKSILLSGSVLSAGSGDHIVFFASEILSTKNYIIEMGIRDISDSAVGARAHAGPVFLAFGSGSSFHGVGMLTREDDTQLVRALWQTGSIEPLPTSAASAIVPLTMFLEIRAQTSASSFSFSAFGKSVGNAILPALVGNSDFPIELLTTWNTSSIGRFGLGVYVTATASDPKVIIDYFLVRSHPYL